jgi:hypothetical protein
MFEVPFTGKVEISKVNIALTGMQGLTINFIYFRTCIRKVLYDLI